MRRQIEQHFGAGTASDSLVVTLVSFAYPKGLLQEAIWYSTRASAEPAPRPTSSANRADPGGSAAFVAADPDFPAFFEGVAD